jgi:exodeoxyribonuclease-5
MIWTPQQDAALVAANRWLRDKNGPQVFRLFGYAGVGKTTLAMHLGENASGIVLYAAFTGKAAHVMHRRGCEGASTLHSLIYIYREGIVGYEKKKDENGVEVDDYAKPIRGYWWELNEQSDLAHASLLIVDEVSMVNRELAEHVLSFGKKVLVIGDPFQLPPVKGYGYFMDEEPDVMLTEITRQAADNPIIRASMIVREGGRLRHESCGDCKVIPAYDIRDAELINVDQVLCGTHKKRLSLNDTMRRLLGSKGEVPLKGEKIICLKNLREEKSNFDDNYHDDDDYDDDDNENVKVRKQPLIMRNGETLTLTEDAILRLGEGTKNCGVLERTKNIWI